MEFVLLIKSSIKDVASHGLAPISHTTIGSFVFIIPSTIYLLTAYAFLVRTNFIYINYMN